MATPPPPQQGAAPHNPYGTPPQQGAAPQHNPYAMPQQPQPQGVPYGNPYAAYQQQPQPRQPHQAGYACRFCGAQPAAPGTVRGHQGMVLMMRFLSTHGPFCRDCGTSIVRDMSAKTLWQGWWGPASLFITPLTVLVNLVPRSAFRKLGPPVGGFRPPLDPGKPLWQRPPALIIATPMALIALSIVALIVIGAATS
ncbi:MULTISPECIES: hypothetical protein [unclassified Streptomyces]|uniref:hypothetical protein n=1 Tax=unclassified Streptomyces TaxID=2593676 RepID=UPI00109E7113|nr:hypothetical protein [Streptomyces sp. A1136]THA58395.1 hypothetical protein E6R62_04395 [Streptomyces sp. A1136]